jgi:hypothetical protein
MVLYERLTDKMGLILSCGHISYSEMPKFRLDGIKRIMGVSGTISHLN